MFTTTSQHKLEVECAEYSFLLETPHRLILGCIIKVIMNNNNKHEHFGFKLHQQPRLSVLWFI